MSDVGAALRNQIHETAKSRCEYCLTPEIAATIKHEVYHIIARKHGGQTVRENLALCCILCNKHKGSDLTSIDPETGAVEVLFHPRRDLWNEHFELRGAKIIPRTAEGRVTVRLLQLNHPERVEERTIMIEAGLMHVERPSE